VQFEGVVSRLESLPDVLPPPPTALMPVRTDGVADWRPRVSLDSLTPRPASVLVLLYPDEDGETRVVLTERVDRGGHHSGEVSFPGGSAEPEDRDVAATALREAAEEIGLDADAARVRIIGQLEAFWIPVSNFRVTPILAVAGQRPVLAANPTEVARIVEAPVRAFMPDGEIEIVERDVRGWPLRYGGYPIEGLHVWGATARILGQVGALLAVSD
jgi:8-oxo-dGTP pyrophosphatase MutT (NUDIX family)